MSRHGGWSVSRDHGPKIFNIIVLWKILVKGRESIYTYTYACGSVCLIYTQLNHEMNEYVRYDSVSHQFFFPPISLRLEIQDGGRRRVRTVNISFVEVTWFPELLFPSYFMFLRKWKKKFKIQKKRKWQKSYVSMYICIFSCFF